MTFGSAFYLGCALAVGYLLVSGGLEYRRQQAASIVRAARHKLAIIECPTCSVCHEPRALCRFAELTGIIL
jgi:hypothetical protein